MNARIKKAPSIRSQFRRAGLRCTSVQSAAREINRLIGLLRVEQNRRLIAEGRCVQLARLARPQHPVGGFFNPIDAWETQSLADELLNSVAASRASVVAPEGER